MHHLDDPALAVIEIARVLRASSSGGGVLVIIDMISHNREEYRHSMGHKHLGFSERDVRAWARRAGFASPRYVPLRPDTAARGPGLFVASMRMTSTRA
jgi:ArsR family transcriptional regulator